MPATRKRAQKPEDAPADVPMCSNHPGTPSVHTTSGILHQPISLCAKCLRKIGTHIQEH